MKDKSDEEYITAEEIRLLFLTCIPESYQEEKWDLVPLFVKAAIEGRAYKWPKSSSVCPAIPTFLLHLAGELEYRIVTNCPSFQHLKDKFSVAIELLRETRKRDFSSAQRIYHIRAGFVSIIREKYPDVHATFGVAIENCCSSVFWAIENMLKVGDLDTSLFAPPSSPLSSLSLLLPSYPPLPPRKPAPSVDLFKDIKSRWTDFEFITSVEATEVEKHGFVLKDIYDPEEELIKAKEKDRQNARRSRANDTRQPARRGHKGRQGASTTYSCLNMRCGGKVGFDCCGICTCCGAAPAKQTEVRKGGRDAPSAENRGVAATKTKVSNPKPSSVSGGCCWDGEDAAQSEIPSATIKAA